MKIKIISIFLFITTIISCGRENIDKDNIIFHKNNTSFLSIKSLILNEENINLINYTNNSSFENILHIYKSGNIYKEIKLNSKDSISVDLKDLSSEEKKQLKVNFSVVLDSDKKILDLVDCNDGQNINSNNKVFYNETISFSSSENADKDIFFCELKNDWKYQTEPANLPKDPGPDGLKRPEGVITNSYGIRDDILRWIILESFSSEIQKNKLIDIAKNYNNLINSYLNKEQNILYMHELLQNVSQLSKLYKNSEFINIMHELEYHIVNTKERFLAVKQSDVNFSGHFYDEKNDLLKSMNDGCQEKILTKYYFGNGMFNTSTEALISMYSLADSVVNIYQGQKEHTIYNYISFSVAYNENEQALLQLIHVLEQKLEDSHWEEALKWLDETSSTPLSIQKSIIEINKLHSEYIDSDLQNFIKRYSDDLNSLNTVVLVSHSQGNFYANEVEKYFWQNQDKHLQRLFMYNFYNYQVATPVSLILRQPLIPVYNKYIFNLYGDTSKCQSAGFIENDKLTDEIKKCTYWIYSTNDNDRIIGGVSSLFRTLPPNIVSDKVLDSDNILHHSFIGSYLSNPKFNNIISGFLTSVTKNSYIIENENENSISLNASFTWENENDHYISRLKSYSDLKKSDFRNELWPNDFESISFEGLYERNAESYLKTATILLNYISESDLSDNNYLSFYQNNFANSPYPMFHNGYDFYEELENLNIQLWVASEEGKSCFSSNGQYNEGSINFNCFFNNSNLYQSNNFNKYASVNTDMNTSDFTINNHRLDYDEKYDFMLYPPMNFDNKIYNDNIGVLIKFNNKCKYYQTNYDDYTVQLIPRQITLNVNLKIKKKSENPEDKYADCDSTYSNEYCLSFTTFPNLNY